VFQLIKAELKQWLIGQCCCEVTTQGMATVLIFHQQLRSLCCCSILRIYGIL